MTKIKKLKPILKRLTLAFLILSIGLILFYLFNPRFIKFYEEEPYPIFESDFSDLDAASYLNEHPESVYPDYDIDKKVIDIRDYGAKDAYFDILTNDGIKINTDAINSAINVASLNEWIVLIPEGNYIAGTIELKDNVIMRIKGNLIGSRDRDDYDPKHFIIGQNIKNVIIEGTGGCVMGEGEYFWNNPFLKPLESNPEISDLRMLQLNHFLSKREKKSNRPSPFILFDECENILIRNLLIRNSPGWTLTFEQSHHIEIMDTVLDNNLRGGNVDGIDIVATSDVKIDNVLISTADDAIVLKNPKFNDPVSMNNIRISRTTLITTTNGFKIGTETYSDISDVWFMDSIIDTNHVFPGAISGVAIESVDGAQISNINVENITMKGVLAPLFIRLGNRNKYGDKDLMSRIDGINIKNIKSTNCQLPSIISGVKDKGTILKATNIAINDLNAEYKNSEELIILFPSIPEKPSDYPDAWMFGDVPACGMYIRHAEVDYENVNITPRTVNTREKIIIEN